MAQPPHTSTKTLKKILAQQGFSGALKGKITIERLGIFHCGSRQLETFYHTWEQTWGARHAAYRIVFLEGGTKYVGQYRVSDRPAQISQNAILFNFSDDDGNIIQCDGDNLPESVVIDEERATLFK